MGEIGTSLSKASASSRRPRAWCFGSFGSRTAALRPVGISPHGMKYMDYIWIIYMDIIWIVSYQPYIHKIWTISGYYMDYIWILYGFNIWMNNILINHVARVSSPVSALPDSPLSASPQGWSSPVETRQAGGTEDFTDFTRDFTRVSYMGNSSHWLVVLISVIIFMNFPNFNV